MEFDFFVYHDNYKKILSISPVEQSDYPYPYVKIPYGQVQTYLEGKEKLSQANIIFYNSKPYLINQNFSLEINPTIKEFKKIQSGAISVLDISLNSFGEMIFKLNTSRIKNPDENFPDTIISFYITPIDDHDILYQNDFNINELIQSQKIGFKIPKGLDIDQIDIWINDVFALYSVDVLEKHSNVELSGLYDCRYNKPEVTFYANYKATEYWLETTDNQLPTSPIYCCKNSDPTIVYQTIVLSPTTPIRHKNYDFYSFGNNIQFAGTFRIYEDFQLIKKAHLTLEPLTVVVAKNLDLSVVYTTTDIDKTTFNKSFDYFSKKIPIKN